MVPLFQVIDDNPRDVNRQFHDQGSLGNADPNKLNRFPRLQDFSVFNLLDTL